MRPIQTVARQEGTYAHLDALFNEHALARGDVPVKRDVLFWNAYKQRPHKSLAKVTRGVKKSRAVARGLSPCRMRCAHYCGWDNTHVDHV